MLFRLLVVLLATVVDAMVNMLSDSKDSGENCWKNSEEAFETRNRDLLFFFLRLEIDEPPSKTGAAGKVIELT
jgi:hypothetical protein